MCIQKRLAGYQWRSGYDACGDCRRGLRLEIVLIAEGRNDCDTFTQFFKVFKEIEVSDKTNFRVHLFGNARDRSGSEEPKVDITFQMSILGKDPVVVSAPALKLARDDRKGLVRVEIMVGRNIKVKNRMEKKRTVVAALDIQEAREIAADKSVHMTRERGEVPLIATNPGAHVRDLGCILVDVVEIPEMSLMNYTDNMSALREKSSERRLANRAHVLGTCSEEDKVWSESDRVQRRL